MMVRYHLLRGLAGCVGSLIILSGTQATVPASEFIYRMIEKQQISSPSGTTSDTPAGSASKKRGIPTPVPAASITISCGNGTKFKLEVSGGTCEVLTDPSNQSVIGGQCGGTSGNYSIGHCAVGCSQTGGNGSCSPVN